SLDFLKRQPLPSLQAGIFCSPTYLYSVSGLTPRYCEAWRMFMTSRESAIIQSLSTENAARCCALMRATGQSWEKNPRSYLREFWCPEHISTQKMLESRRISVFYRVLWVVSGNWLRSKCRMILYLAPLMKGVSTNWGIYTVGSQ